MNTLEAIKRADDLRPNAIEEETKAEWLVQFDGDIAELMKVPAPENLWPQEQELLMPAPKEDIYVLWLMARIDLANEESSLYANDMVVANSAITEARSWWFRNYGNPNKSYVRT